MKNLKRIFIFTLIFLLSMPSFAFAKEAFTISNYDVNINVKEDNSYEITETINTDFHKNKRHGIYRYIPLISSATRTLNGKDIKTTQINKIKDVSVENFDFSEDYGFTDYTIQIGNADKYITGKQKYVIKYTYILGNDGIDEFDDVYYNLIGNDWDTTIDKVTFTINMPKSFDKNLINFTSGSYGSTKNNVKYSVNGNTITGYTTSKLNPNESVTVRIELPNEYFTSTASVNKLYDIIAIAMLVISLIVIIILFNVYGRDDKLFKQIEFYPPEGLSPPEIGYISKTSASANDMVSLIVYFASKGYIKIKEKSKKNIELIKLKDLPSNAKEFEKIFFDALFEDGNTIDTKKLKKSENFGSDVLTSLSLLSDEFHSDRKRLSSKKSVTMQIISSIMLCIVALISFTLTIYQSIFIFGFAIIFAAIITVVIGVFLLLLILTIKKGHLNDKFNQKFFVSLEIILCLVVGFVASIAFSYIGLSMLTMLIQFILIIISAVFIGLMYKRSEYSNKMLSKILGFKDFLERAEKDRIERLVNENPSYFFDILPYAYVLNVSKKWIKQFEGIATTTPEWYVPYDSGDIITHYWLYSNLTRNLDTFSTSTNSAIFTSSSEGIGGGFGGGGGFSGGGFGGGGGGSW